MNYLADPKHSNEPRGYDCGQEESEAQGAETQQAGPQGIVQEGQPPPQELREVDEEGGPSEHGPAVIGLLFAVAAEQC